MERHPIDVLSLLAGLIAVGVGIVVLLPGVALSNLAEPWVWPTLLVLAGLALLTSSFSRRDRGRPEAPTPDDDVVD